jgi:hypothetical protein
MREENLFKVGLTQITSCIVMLRYPEYTISTGFIPEKKFFVHGINNTHRW